MTRLEKFFDGSTPERDIQEWRVGLGYVAIFLGLLGETIWASWPVQ